MHCPHCQTPVSDEARFCPHCGTALHPAAAPTTGAGADTPITAKAPAATPPTTPSAAAPAEQPVATPHAAPEPMESPATSRNTTAPLPPPPPPPAEQTRPLEAVVSAPTPAVQPAWPSGEPRRSAPPRRTWGIVAALLGVLSTVLLLALGVGAAYATVQIRQRNTTISTLQGQMHSLTDANIGLQDQVRQLTDQRDRLTQERDQVTQERDKLAGEAAALRSSNAELQTKVSSLQQSLDDRNRQLQQAQQEASRQQSRAATAEQAGTVLAKVVVLDNEIHKEFGNLVEAFIDMQDAYRYGSAVAYQQASSRANASIQRLRDLFAQRNALLSQLPS